MFDIGDESLLELRSLMFPWKYFSTILQKYLFDSLYHIFIWQEGTP